MFNPLPTASFEAVGKSSAYERSRYPMEKLTKFLSYLLVAILASLATLYFVVPRLAPTHGSKLDVLESYLDTVFVEDLDMTMVEDQAAEAMIAATGDRWSYYIPASEYRSFTENADNAYVGIGVTISWIDEPAGFEIVSLVEGGPAQEAGLQVHDVLVEVAGNDCTDSTADETKTLVVGLPGSTVDIVVLRDGERIPFTVERRKLLIPVATWTMLDSGYALIHIEDFQSRCAEETIAAIEEATAEGAKGLVFDVRFNPGGYKTELVKILDYILPEGDLFRSELYNGDTSTDTSDASHIEIPMAVLVNGDSYSAAEFFAAALREYDYAVVVGQQTVGKGFFQQTFLLGDGSAASISTGRYYTPKGESLAGVGLTPDYPVDVDDEMYAQIYFGELAYEDDPQVQQAVAALDSSVQ